MIFLFEARRSASLNREQRESNEITKHIKKVEKLKTELEKEKNKLQSVLSSMGEGLVVCDDNYCITLMNQTAGALLRTTPDKWVGKPIHDFQTIYKKEKNRELEEEDHIVKKVMDNADIVTIKPTDNYFCKTTDGHTFPFSGVAASLLDNGKSAGAILLFRDSTEEYNIDKKKTEFISIASHQLKTPLTAVNWHLELLLSEDAGKLTIDQKNSLNEVYEGNQRMVHIVNDLLNVSRFESDRMMIKAEQVSLADFIAKLVRDSLPLSADKKCELVFESDLDTSSNVKIDKTLFYQVVHNFITNAIRYSPEDVGSEIKVKLSKNGNEYIVSVKDQGIGIPADAQNRIFEKFFRAKNASLKAADGSGLGMYLAKMIMDQSGGKIGFESREGEGSTFFAAIPESGMLEREGEKRLV